jgi:hypothetical protein
VMAWWRSVNSLTRRRGVDRMWQQSGKLLEESAHDTAKRVYFYSDNQISARVTGGGLAPTRSTDSEFATCNTGVFLF